MKYALISILAGCAALLLESFCVRFAAWLLKPRGTRQITLLPVTGVCPDLEARLRWQLFRIDAAPWGKDGVLLVVDCGADTQAIEEAKRLCRGRKNCRVCQKHELAGILGQCHICNGTELVLY